MAPFTSPDLSHSDFIQLYRRDDEAIRAELRAGMMADRAMTSPKFLYDALGSKLFEAICELPEYYPTRIERAIFDTYLYDIARSVGRGATLIDLGAGNCAKAAYLFPLLQPLQYVPVDISVDFLKDAVEALRQRFPQIRMTGIGMDFSSTMELPSAVRREKRVFFYPGSSIGNFSPEDAGVLLGRIRDACQTDSSLLIGVDLVKDKAVLDAAYDDALGVTASFNLNLLVHLNTLMGADFNVRDWRHRGFFNEAESRIEMHLEARRDLTVHWPDGLRRFVEGERIHTENSYKYTQPGFQQLLERTGFSAAQTWTDERGWFMVCHARAA
ncbi:L-histidine N(alpha)-methyltransferase [Noviherbaspirillum saxi]|uniref:L-histidine N(Alpha)-methyltransferase n=1 Tax=Noviherbaspirillum saxi TaxID=2320863 RepID=A0A3A3GBB2_9BURK|nr:L-histidine N(alpha)-methyltransferase [Noviherbaspirillum saxi]RJF98179.1 L-histidine N(alpha)-methyltransferase [Noviherbaspirillum saxi]